jgi:heptosyltransferase-2
VAAELLIRTPNHLGDLVMALPALAAVPGADLLAPRAFAPLFDLVPELRAGGGRVVHFERGTAPFFRIARELRRARYRRGVLLTPSFSSAFLFAAGGVAERRGSATDGRTFLLTDPVPPAQLDGVHRSAAYLALVRGERPGAAPLPCLEVTPALTARWREVAGVAGTAPVVGIFPGGNASSRRWEPARFAELADRLARGGARVVVFGGPSERALAAQVAGTTALDVSGKTDLPLLAAALADCHLLVTNDSGPMHLAAAVGTPTVSLWGAGDPAVTAPLGAGHELLRGAALPCMPCVKNECPRRGQGFVLAEAERECLRLVECAQVAAVVERKLNHPTQR